MDNEVCHSLWQLSSHWQRQCCDMSTHIPCHHCNCHCIYILYVCVCALVCVLVSLCASHTYHNWHHDWQLHDHCLVALSQQRHTRAHTHRHTKLPLRFCLSSRCRIESVMVSHQIGRVVGWITACGQACHKEHCQQCYLPAYLHTHRLCKHTRL